MITQDNSVNATPALLTRRRILGLILGGVLTYFFLFKRTEPAFNDTAYTALRADLDRTLAYPEGSPEQAVSYMYLGKHLRKNVYGTITPVDLCEWVRSPTNPFRPLFRMHPQLLNDWETKPADGVSNKEHYEGFIAGPVSAARTLFRESVPHRLDELNAHLTRHAGTDPDSLDHAAQERLLWKALVDDPAGRALVEELTSCRSISEQTRGYRKLAQIAGAPGLALRWVLGTGVWILAAVLVIRRLVREQRSLQGAVVTTTTLAEPRPMRPALFDPHQSALAV